MRILLLVAMLGGVAHADRAHTRLHYTDAAIALLKQRCGKTAAWWCKAVDWDAGTAAPLPIGKPLVGIAITIGEPGQKVRSATKLEVGDRSVGCIVTGTADHPQIWLGELGDKRAEELRAHAGEFAVTQVDDEWYWDDKSDDLRLRKVDGVWIAILSPPPAAARAYPDARIVYVLTDAVN